MYEERIAEEKAQEQKYRAAAIWGLVAFVVLIVLIILGFMFGLPIYNMWAADKAGRAELAKAEYSKQVQIQEAKSNLEAEKLNAEAEVERAKGAAKSRQTEGLGMTPEQYVQYLWVKKLSLSKSQTIYLPTENGLPVLNKEVGK